MACLPWLLKTPLLIYIIITYNYLDFNFMLIDKHNKHFNCPTKKFLSACKSLYLIRDGSALGGFFLLSQ